MYQHDGDTEALQRLADRVTILHGLVVEINHQYRELLTGPLNDPAADIIRNDVEDARRLLRRVRHNLETARTKLELLLNEE